MIVKLVGKTHLEGVSKRTGKPFSNTVAYINGKENGVSGYKAFDIWLDPVQYPVESLVENADYNLEYNNRGFVASFTLVK